MTEVTPKPLRLLADDPSLVDLLSFDAIAQTIADALLDESLDPVALGLSGTWGSGKTTVLNLVESELGVRTTEEHKVLVVRTAPWRYDPVVGAKETLIGEVLGAIQTELKGMQNVSGKAKKLVKSLAARVDWAKALKVAATTAVTLQLPNPADLVELVKPKTQRAEDARGLDEFRAEFKQLLSSKALHHVRAVVVLVDDLDRCLPTTVVDSLEAMRLFLDVPKMSFVIAADEDRVAEAIGTRFASNNISPEDAEDAEQPAKLYLHKIVQTAFRLPALSSFDTFSFLLLLLMRLREGDEAIVGLVEQCAQVRMAGGTADDLEAIEGLDFSEEFGFATRLTPMLHEKMRGNPRRIKRFLNDLEVRQVVGLRRGISLDLTVVAKLMVLEVILAAEFTRMLGWFATGELREKLTRLEKVATGSPHELTTDSNSDEAGPTEGEFSDSLIRWAKLLPPLSDLDLSPYFTLAASFAGVVLIDEKLPERLRDLASNLLSDARVEQASVTDADLDALGEGDVINLVDHIGRTLRDQPSRQKAGVNALLRIGRRFPNVSDNVASALRLLSGRDVTIATPLQFNKSDHASIRAVLTLWKESSPEKTTRSIENALGQGN